MLPKQINWIYLLPRTVFATSGVDHQNPNPLETDSNKYFRLFSMFMKSRKRKNIVFDIKEKSQLTIHSLRFLILVVRSKIINGPNNGNDSTRFCSLPWPRQLNPTLPNADISIFIREVNSSGDKMNVNVYCLRSVYLPYCLSYEHWILSG